ncbi:MAG: dihydroorotate dehydrogenase [Verrucomicrobiota bacterium]|nr:dihydroorotate dehydrogenase [Verrucomicrobiota bacterium]
MIETWYPTQPAIYDISKSYLENFEQGPFFQGKIPERPPSKATIDFLGHKLRSPLGVPAGPLLNSRWTTFAANLGFDLVTYKTIRSFAHSGHALPNMIYIEPIGTKNARQIGQPPSQLNELTVTNSFGMPSRSPEFLLTDIPAAKAALAPGQALIVSIVGTPDQGVSFCEDFVRTAVFAKEAGATLIEANFSCPNVAKAEGSLYQSPDAVYEYARAIARAIHPVPLILKIGEIEDSRLLQQVLQAAARAGAQAVCGLNSVSMQVTTAQGAPALGAHRLTSGVCGGAIRSRALHFLREASKHIRNDRLGLTLMGCGGITSPHHFDEFLEAGAQVALTATGMMWDPFLAMRYHRAH